MLIDHVVAGISDLETPRWGALIGYIANLARGFKCLQDEMRIPER
jgi:hypothetical protein